MKLMMTCSLPSSSSSSSKSAMADLSPLSASDFFAQALEVQPPDNPSTFRVYLAPPTSKGKDGEKGTILVCHHGGGASGLSFAALAKAVTERSEGELGVMSFDCRGHGGPLRRDFETKADESAGGKTRTSGSKEVEAVMSGSNLLSDFLDVVQHLFPDPKEAPPLLVNTS